MYHVAPYTPLSLLAIPAVPALLALLAALAALAFLAVFAIYFILPSPLSSPSSPRSPSRSSQPSCSYIKNISVSPVVVEAQFLTTRCEKIHVRAPDTLSFSLHNIQQDNYCRSSCLPGPCTVPLRLEKNCAHPYPPLPHCTKTFNWSFCSQGLLVDGSKILKSTCAALSAAVSKSLPSGWVGIYFCFVV